MDGEAELKVLFPGTDVKVGGETLTVTPLKFTQWLRAAKLVRPLVELFNQSGIVRSVRGKDERGKDVTSFVMAEDFGAKLVNMVADGGEPLIAFMAFAVNKEKDWLDTLDGDEGMNLAKAIFSENTNFFVERMMPVLQDLMGAANPLTSETSSPDSSKQDTPSTPSVATPAIK